jgi:hypothetical protein
MTVVNHLNGRTNIIIPRSAFPKSGLWRVKASVALSGKQHVSDDVSFTLTGIQKPASKTGTMKTSPSQNAPSAIPVHPAATQKTQPLPATPARKAKPLMN